MTVSVLWLFLMVPWVSLQFVIVVFHGHTDIFLYCGVLGPKILLITSNLTYKVVESLNTD